MRNALSALGLALTAVALHAQYKTPQPAPGSNPGAVQITPNSNIQLTAPSGEEELAKARRIGRDEAMRLVRQKKAIYVDVRSKDSYDDGHLPGAISLPLSDLPKRFKDVPLKKILITYCA